MSDLFKGTRGKPDAQIAIVGEAYGEEESHRNEPFCGGAGLLLTSLLKEANIDPEACFYTNIVNARPHYNDLSSWFIPGNTETVAGLKPGSVILAGLNTLYSQLDAYPRKLTIAAGNYPLWALTNDARIDKGTEKPRGDKAPTPNAPVGIGDFHGSQLYRVRHRIYDAAVTSNPVLPIYHPAGILRDWSTRHITVHDLRMRVKLAFENKWNQDFKQQFLAPPSFDECIAQLAAWVYYAETQGGLILSCDVETKRQSILTCIGLADDRVAMSIPFVKILGKDSFASYWAPREEAIILTYLSRLLHHKNVGIIGQNFIYDAQWFWHVLRMRPRVIYDTMIGEHLAFPGVPKGLGQLSAKYCARHRFWKDDNREWSETGTLEQHLRYNCEDLVRTYEIAFEQKQVLSFLKKDTHLEFEMQKFELAREMNENGIRRDPSATLHASQIILEQMYSLAAQLSRLVKQEWVNPDAKTPWYRSDSQIKYVLYTLLSLPPQIDRKTKRVSSGKEALNTLRESFPRLRKLFQKLADYGSLDTIHSTFIASRTESTGFFHCSFSPTGTITYRWNSSKNAFGRGNNMQNVPVGDSEDDTSEKIKKPNIRRVFVPDTNDDLFLDCDLKGADAQIVAWEANDEKLKTALRKGIKIHKETAFGFFGQKFLDAPGDTGNKLTPKGKMYDDIKRATHGTNYGASGKTIATNLGWPLSEGERFRYWWLKVEHPGIGEWHQRTEHSLRTTRGVRNALGYSIIYYDRIDGLLPEALAWIPQSSVALVSFLGALAIKKRFREERGYNWPRFKLQVHDSIVMQLPWKERNATYEIQELLNINVPYPDPLVIGSKIQYSRKSWGDLVEFDPKIGIN